MSVATPDTARQPAARQPLPGLAGVLQRPSQIAPSPWPGWEHVRGFGVFALPFSSGHVLALRVVLESDFGPFATLWQRTPAGDWALYYDAPRADLACPRYFGPAARHVQPAHLTLTWTGPLALRVEMDAPALDWAVSLRETPLLRAMNAVSVRLPLSTWRPWALVQARAWMARRLLGMGDVTLVGRMPSGHQGLLMPARIFFVAESHATLDGVDLGAPIRLRENPKIGTVGLPARPTFAVGQAFFKRRDAEEDRHTVEELRPSARARPTTVPRHDQCGQGGQAVPASGLQVGARGRCGAHGRAEAGERADGDSRSPCRRPARTLSTQRAQGAVTHRACTPSWVGQRGVPRPPSRHGADRAPGQ